MASVEVKYDITPHDGKPTSWDAFDMDLLNAAAKTDDRGYSLADHF